MTVISSRDGGLRVRVNDQGTPLDIAIDPRRLRRDPQVLAADIVRLCREGAAAAGERRLAELRRDGVPEQILAAMRPALVPAGTVRSGPPTVPGGAVRSWIGRG